MKTPISTETKLTKDVEGESIDNTEYRGMIGSLLYLTTSRPDIMFSVCLCAYFQEDPKTSYPEPVKRIFRYVKGTMHLGLWYPKGSGIETIVYADSNHAGDYVDRKSTSEGGNVLSEKFLDLDSIEDLHPPLHVNQLSGSTTYSLSPNQLLEMFTDEHALDYSSPSLYDEYDDDLQFDIESDLKEIEFLLHQDIDSSLKDSIDQSNLANHTDNVVNSIPKMFTDEHALDYSSPLIFDEYDDFLEIESDAENVYDDPFDSKGEKIKESKLLINELDLPCDFLLSEYDSFISQDFSRVDSKPSTNNKDKDFDPPLYEPFFFKEVPSSKMLLLFSSENEEKVFKPGIHTSEKVHSSFTPELSHSGYKIFKTNQIFKTPMKIFLFSCRKDTHTLAVPCLYFYPP
nr:uncharacterized mitochondrial protein AtMg00810-like [Tanacetum cinerariifolium]